MFKRFLFAALLLSLSVLSVFGQTGQIGSIRGVVTSPDGVPAPGVTVVLKSPAMVLSKMETVTNTNGSFRFMSLPPGKYEIMFQSEGMDTVVRKGIVVNANVNVTMDIQMQLKTIEQQIVVEGKAPTVDRQSVTKTATLDKEFLNSIPAARNLGTYFNMTPGVTANSAHGAAVRDNSYNLDGVQMNDPVVGTASSGYSMEIMEEISVQSGGLSAEYGSVKGAVVNVLTKSGGNDFSGALTMYYNNKDMVTDNTKGTPLEGTLSGAKYEIEPGFTMGGPVVKDQLWFFTNLSVYRSAFYTSGYPHNQEAQVPNKDNKFLPYVKLTWQPSQSDKFVVAFNYNKRSIDNDGASRWKTVDTTTTYDSPSYTLSAQWTHTYGSNLITNFKIGAFSTELNWLAKVHDGWYIEDTNWKESVSNGWDDLNPRKRLQINFDGTLFMDNFMGSHEVKFGVQNTNGRGRRIVKTYGPKDEKGFSRVWNRTWNGELYYAEYYIGHDRIDDVFNVGIFANDTWNISKNLTINAGLRFDYNRNYFPKHGDNVSEVAKGDFGYIGYPDQKWDMTIPESTTAFTWKNLSPRIGVIYDLFSDGSTLVKANFSRYLQDNYTTISFELHPVNWVGYGAYMNPDGTIASIDYTWVPGVNTKVGYNGEPLKAPYTNEITFGVERELWEDWSVDARFIRRWDRDLIEDVDASVVDIDALMQEGALLWKNYRKVTVTDPYNNASITFWDREKYIPADKYMVNPPGAKRDYTAVEFTLNKRYSNGWSLMASYVYNQAEGLIGTAFWDSEGRTGFYNDPNAHVNAYGRMPLERRHQVKINASVKGPWGINLSSYIAFLSGQRYTRTVSSRDLGLTMNAHTTVFAEARGSNGYPNQFYVDLRVEKYFRLSNRLSFSVFCDIFNLFNTNTTTGVITSSSNPNYTFGATTSIFGPQVFRVGGKIELN